MIVSYKDEKIEIDTSLGNMYKFRMFEETQIPYRTGQENAPSVRLWVERLISDVVSPPYNDTKIFDSLPDDIQTKILGIISDAYPLSSFFDIYIAQSRGKKRMEQEAKDMMKRLIKEAKTKKPKTKTRTQPASTS